MRNARNQILTLILALVMFVSGQVVLGVSNMPRMGMPMAVKEGIDYTALYEEEERKKDVGFKTSEVFPYARQKKAVKDFSAVNSDIKAWLYVPGTNINHPIAYSNQDNSYYLYRDWKGKKYSGITWQNWSQYPECATYIDYRATIGDSWANSSKNIVLYGHNWNNLREPMTIGNYAGYTMFAQLPSYTNLEFAKKNTHIYFSTGEYEGIWRVFAAGYCVISPEFYYNNSNPTKKGMQFIIDEWRQLSLFNFDVDVTTDDRLLTLSTCTRQHGSNNTQRYVVVARLLRSGESESDPVDVVVNPNIKPLSFKSPASKSPSATDSAAESTAPAETTTPTSADNGTALASGNQP